MNFDYIKEAEPETEELKDLYDSLCRILEEAEEMYWSRPQKCGAMLRNAAEKICRIYNTNYSIGFAETASLEEFLCYTNNDEHNQMVSRFLSVVRMNQRERLEWLRVWGDECVFMGEHPEEIQKSTDKLYLDVKKMMVATLAATKEMCQKINHMENIENRTFEEAILPGYLSEEEQESRERKSERENRKNRLQKLFKR